jgi:hypothetical protein
MDIKYPKVKVKLIGEDGNAFAIIGAVRKAMKRGGCTPEQVEEFQKEATAGDYNHLLQTAMRFVDVS